MGGFLVRKRGLSKQDTVVMFVRLLISVFFFFFLNVFFHKVRWNPDREAARGYSTAPF